MNLIINEKSLTGRLNNVFRAPAPTTYRARRSPHSTGGELTGKGASWEWLAQQTWEDDGGRTRPGLDPRRG